MTFTFHRELASHGTFARGEPDNDHYVILADVCTIAMCALFEITGKGII